MSSRKKWPVVSPVPGIQKAYEASRRQGECHNISEIVAFRQVPGVNTDTSFMSGCYNQNQFAGSKGPNEVIAKGYVELAKRAGVTDLGARRYVSQIARYPGDARAWIGSKGELRKKIAATGDGCSDLGVKATNRIDARVLRKTKKFKPQDYM